tara:strand:+ start:19350 stop:20894 length:1545 start_codon:yes stop_codon:yes gene_type:complete
MSGRLTPESTSPDSLDTDILVIGGGINGAGIAADAAGRGLSVVLCDKADLGGATSSSSTKLIHGGLRYLETWQFRLVRESLQEREVLLKSAPHIVWPMRFRLPHHPGLRPAWMIRAGLFLYDHLGKRVTLPASHRIRFSAADPLLAQYSKGFEYSDCWVDDARLVVLNAMQAATHGATILPRTRCTALKVSDVFGPAVGSWQATLRDEVSGDILTVNARCVVNAAGPWVSSVAGLPAADTQVESVRLVKGSHIVVPRIHAGDEAYLLQSGDGRVVFVIPYEDDFSLIGTTEQEYTGDPALAEISAEEKIYLCDVVNQYFKGNITPQDILHDFAGVRPLTSDDEDNASRVSRDYTLHMDMSRAPLLSVYGGKITTYRRLAESAAQHLAKVFPDLGRSWTAEAVLPGGDFASQTQLLFELCGAYPDIEPRLMLSWVRRYGTLTWKLLAGCKTMADLGALLGPGLYAREVEYLQDNEWARTADDILWRRTKAGLYFNQRQHDTLADYLSSRTETADA